MAPKKTPDGGPMMAVADWLRHHPDLAKESVAGFLRHVASAAWDTPEGWERRWAAWLHHTI